MLLPGGNESFLFRSGNPSERDVDCCHIILKKAIIIHSAVKSDLSPFPLFDHNSFFCEPFWIYQKIVSFITNN